MSVKWTPKLNTGYKALDNHHKRLAKETNKLFDKISQKGVSGVLEKTVNFLDEYIPEHHAHEEGLMVEKKYPGIGKHKRAHIKMRKRFKELKDRLEKTATDKTFATEVHASLSHWFMQHEAREDQKFAEYLRKLK